MTDFCDHYMCLVGRQLDSTILPQWYEQARGMNLLNCIISSKILHIRSVESVLALGFSYSPVCALIVRVCVYVYVDIYSCVDV